MAEGSRVRAVSSVLLVLLPPPPPPGLIPIPGTDQAVRGGRHGFWNPPQAGGCPR